MPKMGESITEGTIIEWHVNVGDSFEEGDVLLEVATDKVDNEVPASSSGKMLEHKYSNGDVVPIGAVIAILEVSESAVSDKAPSKTSEMKGKSKVSTSTSISSSSSSRISGTGKDGRLRKSDVSEYLESGRPFQFAQAVSEPSGFQVPDLKFDKGKGKIVEMDRMRQMIADHMVFSKHTSPHVTAYAEADLTEMVNWRNKNKEAFQKKYNEKLTFTPLFIECVAKAIKDFPMINSTLDGRNIIVKDEINIGMATALPSGNLIVPVVRNADKKDLKELAQATNELVGKSRDNKLKGDDTKGSTFTISNVGTFGSLMGTPIINQPEAAILATGIIKKRAEVMERKDGDTIEIRQIIYLSLSFDHRIVDGYLAGSFLKRIADYMEKFDLNRTF